MVVPIIGARLVSPKIRIVFAISVTLALMPAIPPVPSVDALSILGFIVVIQQILIGAVMGFIVQLLFQIPAFGGQLIAMQNGLGMSKIMDPLNGVNVATIGQLFLMTANLIFLALNGHLVMFQVLAESFNTLPISEGGLPYQSYKDLVGYTSWMFASSLLIALPTIVALLIVNMSFGVISKVASQFNIISIGFPFNMVFGLFIIWAAMSDFLPQFERFTEECLFMLKGLVLIP